MNTLMNNDLLKIEKEIVSMKNRVAQDLIQIGQKLIDAKRLVPHGEWSVWLSEKVGFSQRTANNLMRVAKELGENSQSLSNLEATKLYMLLECILRSLADSDAFQSGRCAEHNGRPETLAIIN